VLLKKGRKLQTLITPSTIALSSEAGALFHFSLFLLHQRKKTKDLSLLLEENERAFAFVQRVSG
jgi:hypothetical protein